MRKLIVQEFVTIDGMAATADGNVDFVPASNEGDPTFGQRHVTYEMFAAYWPTATTGDDRELAGKINTTPKVVVSSTLQRAPWGSLSLARSLADNQLVDEYQLIVCPLIMGKGQPLFGDGSAASGLRLLDTRTFERGQVLLTYGRGQDERG